MLQFTRLVLFALLLIVPSAHAQQVPTSAPDAPRSVILMIADGTGPAAITMARDFARTYMGKDELALDAIQVGALRTFSTSSRVTDSAAGATAFATGEKSYNGAIAVDTLRQPLTTLVQAAESRGMATGIVATSRITHATPAAFIAHVPDRAMENEIAAEMLQDGVDVVIGGGLRAFIKGEGSYRKDDLDLIAEAGAEGYTVALTRRQFDGLSTVPAIALLTPSEMSFDIDRDDRKEPSLAEMTSKAIDLLSSNPGGFFLMVEGSRIDHAAHANDAPAMVREVLAYDKAVAAALQFARSSKNTLVISVADHETGGMSLGRDNKYEWHAEALAGVTASRPVIVDSLLSAGDHPQAAFGRMTGISDLTADEAVTLARASGDRGALDTAVEDFVDRRALVGWTTRGHSAVDVNLYAFGPGSARFVGNHDNTFVARTIADLLGLKIGHVALSVSDAN